MVIHYTAMASTQEALERLCDPAFEVSAHYLVSEQGEVLALVPEELRAWHAGAGSWGGLADLNSRSIGIELANRGTHPFSHPQMLALVRLLEGILARWSIPPERVIGHSDMAPDRKFDPGPRFDWRRLARQGLSVWPEVNRNRSGRREAGQATTGQLEQDDSPAEPFLSALATFGYDTSLNPDLLLQAFRARFRPWARGPVGPEDAGAALDLARRFPVDRGAHAA
ncbi:MAG: N-acetylmuramoyl-L-alanine amidase [uncultured Rubellimicrobium sp.]|uniref:N-acetylmuramoyl-L-alanine amidase n=1 Tax=uncultured Rubellimicrobium sp. TaxID=543078 RepID=A0A6J4PWN1_9RHOB|nr:MAG: N-acetylmuramoyl-L-alanine amidase [uncultured Rubellimicrobium sp.]